jgi:hypothetical protein
MSKSAFESDPMEFEHLVRKADRVTRFPAKMSPRLATWYVRDMLNHFSKPHPSFFDPMCGSGTSVLAARALGFEVSASDISYPAVTITRAKLKRLTQKDISDMVKLPDTIRLSVGQPHTKWNNWEIWYRPRVLRTLEKLRDSIFTERNQVYFPHLLATFFQTAWDVSAADKGVIVPTRSRYSARPPSYEPHEVVDKFSNRLRRIVAAQDALSRLNVSVRASQVKQADALKESSWPKNSIDLCMSSPPYGCGIDYERAFRLPMRICRGLIPEMEKSSMIGRRANLDDDEARHLKNFLLLRLRDKELDTAVMLFQYVVDIDRFLDRCASHLSEDGRVCLILGNPQIAKKRIPLVNAVIRMAKEHKLQLVGKPKTDKIPSRRQNFRPRSATGFIREEYLLTFRI